MEEKQNEKSSQERWQNIKWNLQLALFAAPFVAGIIFVIIVVFQSCAAPDPHDGRCDICGKYATYHGTKEEFCDEHSWDAALYYFEQGMNE